MTREPGANHELPLGELVQSAWLTRVLVYVACRLLLGLLRIACWLAAGVGRLRGPAHRSGGARVVLTGMFFADNWVEALIKPLAMSSSCERIWVVTDRPMLELPKTTYVCPPRWLQRVVGRAAVRGIYCLAVAARHRPDVVGGFHLLLNAIVALIGARLAGARSLYFCVGGWTEVWGGGARSENALFRKIGRDSPSLERVILGFVRQVDVILTMGSRAKAFLRDKGVTGLIEVMSGGIDGVRFRADTDGAPPTYDLVTVGRLAPIKRLDVMLDVIAKLASHRPDLKAAIVGDGPQRTAMASRAKRLGISENVTFPGRVEKVEPWLADSRVFVLTSDSEGLSLALIEGMMTGLPAVVSDVGDLGDLVVDGVNGYRPPRRDVDAFAERIAPLLSDEQLYQRFSEQARKAGMAFSTEAASQRWDDLFSRLMDADDAASCSTASGSER